MHSPASCHTCGDRLASKDQPSAPSLNIDEFNSILTGYHASSPQSRVELIDDNAKALNIDPQTLRSSLEWVNLYTIQDPPSIGLVKAGASGKIGVWKSWEKTQASHQASDNQ